MRNQGKPGMTDAQVRSKTIFSPSSIPTDPLSIHIRQILTRSKTLQVEDFVKRFMPAYKAYLPDLYNNGPRDADPIRTLRILVDKHRTPTG